MCVAEEQLTQRRFVKGSMVIEGEGGIPGGERLLTTVLRACLSFAGRKPAGARAGTTMPRQPPAGLRHGARAR